ncbi:hypothetical protein PMIN04_009635 [Paraphaeosphaeria minitans]
MIHPIRLDRCSTTGHWDFRSTVWAVWAVWAGLGRSPVMTRSDNSLKEGVFQQFPSRQVGPQSHSVLPPPKIDSQTRVLPSRRALFCYSHPIGRSLYTHTSTGQLH